MPLDQGGILCWGETTIRIAMINDTKRSCELELGIRPVFREGGPIVPVSVPVHNPLQI